MEQEKNYTLLYFMESWLNNIISVNTNLLLH